MLNMFLSPHFTLEELSGSSFGLKHGIDNTPNEIVLNNLKKGAYVLEYVRSIFHNHPVIVTSGYRCRAINDGVGGSPFSSHLDGLAFDFIVSNGSTPRNNALVLFQKLRVFDQIISYSTFTHLGLGPRNRKQFIFK